MGGSFLRNFAAVAAFSVVGLLIAGNTFRSDAQSNDDRSVQVIEMTARKYEYSPSEIRVKKGTHVQLKLRAADRTHGFKIRLFPDGAPESGEPGLKFAQPQDSWKLDKDRERVLEFVAERPGTYSFKCSVFCGFGHGGMRGRLIVE
jgi:cytochrome c oxidase subunit 2